MILIGVTHHSQKQSLRGKYHPPCLISPTSTYMAPLFCTLLDYFIPPLSFPACLFRVVLCRLVADGRLVRSICNET
jgi:hypothetical protein